MGQFESQFLATAANSVSKHSNPNKPNWITLHAVAAERKYRVKWTRNVFYNC